MRRVFSLIMIFILAFFVVNLLQADTYMKEKKHTDGVKMMGQQQPATDEITEVWLTSKGVRSDSPKNSIIIMIDEKKMIMINHEKKIYHEMPMNMGEIMNQASKQAGKNEKERSQPGADAGYDARYESRNHRATHNRD